MLQLYWLLIVTGAVLKHMLHKNGDVLTSNYADQTDHNHTHTPSDLNQTSFV